MMKRLLSTLAFTLILHSAWAQITITAADMPVWGDTLRFSSATALGASVSAADSGAGIVWNYDDLVPTSQGLDQYRKPAEISPLYSFTLPTSCYGYKIADSIPGIGLIASGITISNLYTFFSSYITPSAYAAEAFGATISGFPVGASYIVPDAWYLFPLTYNRNDSTDFYLKFGLASIATLKQKGYRKSRVDGWGTITTPYFTVPVSCIRVRSELHEIDSVSFDSNTFGIPRVTVEYKYLVNGEHYPAVWATAIEVGGLEVVTGVKYRDVYRRELDPNPVAVANTPADKTEASIYPNPAVDGKATLSLPASWKSFYVDVFDMQSRKVASFANTVMLDLQPLPAGNYVARIISGSNTAFVRLSK